MGSIPTRAIDKNELVWYSIKEVGGKNSLTEKKEYYTIESENTRISSNIGMKVTNEEAIVLYDKGKIVGKVKAEYDFSDVPIKYHTLVLNLLIKQNIVHLRTNVIGEGNGKRKQKSKSRKKNSRIFPRWLQRKNNNEKGL